MCGDVSGSSPAFAPSLHLRPRHAREVAAVGCTGVRPFLRLGSLLSISAPLASGLSGIFFGSPARGAQPSEAAVVSGPPSIRGWLLRRYMQLNKRGKVSAAEWDTAVLGANEDYRKLMHNICVQNCHHHGADNPKKNSFRSRELPTCKLHFFACHNLLK